MLGDRDVGSLDEIIREGVALGDTRKRGAVSEGHDRTRSVLDLLALLGRAFVERPAQVVDDKLEEAGVKSCEAVGKLWIAGGVNAKLDHQKRPIEVGAHDLGPLPCGRSTHFATLCLGGRLEVCADALLDALFEQREEQVGLPRETRIDRTDREACLRRDRVDGGTVEAVPQEHDASRRKERGAVDSRPFRTRQTLNHMNAI